MNTERYAKFKVTDHYFLKGRGALVLGEIQSGTFKIGMKVNIREDGNSLTISGIEFLDNLKLNKFLNALIFKEMPELDYLKNAFPIGFIINAEITD